MMFFLNTEILIWKSAIFKSQEQHFLLITSYIISSVLTSCSKWNFNAVTVDLKVYNDNCCLQIHSVVVSVS